MFLIYLLLFSAYIPLDLAVQTDEIRQTPSIDKEYNNSQFTLNSPKEDYEDFLSEDKLMDLVEFHYPELLLNHKESGTTGMIDKIEVKSIPFKPKGQKFDYIYSQIRFFQEGQYKTLFILHYPDDYGDIDPDLGYRENDINDMPCTDCFLLDVKLVEGTLVGTFATDRTMTRLYTKNMTLNINDYEVKWSEINNK